MRRFFQRQSIPYLMIVAMVVIGFFSLDNQNRKDRQDSKDARLVVCKVINKQDLASANDLIAISKRSEAEAIARGLKEPPTPEEAVLAQESLDAFLASVHARAIPCGDFAKDPGKYLNDPRVRSALSTRSSLVGRI